MSISNAIRKNATSRKLSALQKLSARIGGFSNPEKMPCLSYSIPAKYCGLGAKLHAIDGSTCSDCYALKGRYIMPNVMEAMERRYALLMAALRDPNARAEYLASFVDSLAYRLSQTEKAIARNSRKLAAIGADLGIGTAETLPAVAGFWIPAIARVRMPRDDGRFFRFHDSGDLQTVSHLALICDIAEASPRVSFWLPTRETGIVRNYLKSGRTIPANLTVRLSVPMADSAPAGLIRTLSDTVANVTASGVHDNPSPPSDYETCSAYTRAGYCSDCRSCWDPEKLESYPRH